jgi:hypothetical protein
MRISILDGMKMVGTLGQEAVKKNFSKFEILLLGKNKEKYTFRF